MVDIFQSTPLFIKVKKGADPYQLELVKIKYVYAGREIRSENLEDGFSRER